MLFTHFCTYIYFHYSPATVLMIIPLYICINQDKNNYLIYVYVLELF